MPPCISIRRSIGLSVGQSITFITLPRISMKISGFHQSKKSRRISCNHVIIQSFNQIWGRIVGLMGLVLLQSIMAYRASVPLPQCSSALSCSKRLKSIASYKIGPPSLPSQPKLANWQFFWAENPSWECFPGFGRQYLNFLFGIEIWIEN